MTNFRQARHNNTRGSNQKDGRRTDSRPTKAQRQVAEAEWVAAGFTQEDWNKWSYTWLGEEFPVFSIAPGILTDDTGAHAGLVAQYAPTGIEILFPYGTDPSNIKNRLDDEILIIMRHDAAPDGPPIEWTPPPAEWVDIDTFMEAAF